MVQKKINYGAAPNDGTGDLYRVAMIKIDDNFTDLYAIKVDKTVTIALSGGATGTATALSGAAVVIPVTGLNMGNATEGTLAVARGGTGVTTSTGTGANVQADSPALAGTPTTPLPGAGAADGQIANVKYVKDGLSFKANSDDVTTALALKADKLYVDTHLALKVDKDGNKVLSDNNFTNDERIKLANVQAQATKNLPDATLLERSNHHGTQAIGTIDGLEARLQEGHRVMGIDATDLKDFILQMQAYGPGYYRCESQIEGLPRFAAGLFTAVNGTFTFVAADYVGGQPFVISGASVDVAAGAWNYIEPANRANHSGTQDVVTLTGVLPTAKGGTGQTTKLGIITDLKVAQQQHLNGSVTPVSLEAGKEYSIYSPVANPIYEGVLPSTPNIGDTIVFHNGWGTWNTGRFTLSRGNTNHSINGLKESVTFNTDAVKKVTLTYVWGDIWQLYCEV